MIDQLARVWKFGGDVDTDQIVPGRYAPYMRPNEDVGNAAFIEANPEFNQHAAPGDVILAGDNFGCGSSREYAPLALKRRQVSAILAKSFARIFFRNAVNLGIPVFQIDELYDLLSDGDQVDLNVNASELKFEERSFSLPAIPEFARQIIHAGGISTYVRTTGCFPGTVEGEES